MKRSLAILPILAALVCAAPAGAAKPELVEDVRLDDRITELDPFLSAECGFDVFVTTKGHFRGKLFFDREGNVTRFMGFPSMRHTFTSEWGSLKTADRGVDKVTENADGTLTIFGTGIHFKEHRGASATGLWVLIVDPVAEEILSAEYHGNFDLQADEIVDYICSRLARPQP